jgi:DNA-binding transcriptional MerR regulator
MAEDREVFMQTTESFTIKEVADIVGVEPHVLLYWGSEFPQIAPEVIKDGKRIYSSKDVDVILRIRELLYYGKHTIPGARRELEKEMNGNES